MEAMIMLVKDIGFPIFVSVYLLVRLDRMMALILSELRKMNGKGGEQKV